MSEAFIVFGILIVRSPLRPSDYPALSVLVLHDRARVLRVPALQCGLRRQTQSEWI